MPVMSLPAARRTQRIWQEHLHDARAVTAHVQPAMHDLLARLRGSRVTQFDMECWLFDFLAEPVI